MTKMLVRLLIQTADKLKPLLIKVFPKKMLSFLKRKALKGMFQKLENYQVRPYKKGMFLSGVNLIGNVKAETGLGQSCRLLANLLDKTEIQFGIYFYDSLAGTNNTEQSWNGKITKKLPYAINLIHINPSELPVAYTKLPREIWEGHYNIAFWLWELEEFPQEWVPCFRLFHEIWTPSEFISSTLRKKTNKPVKTVPYFITAETEEGCGRKFFGLPEDKFLYLMMYDSASITERKNPEGVIEAFKMAFSAKTDNVGLVIKMKSGSMEEEKELRRRLKDYDNVYLIKGVLSKAQVNSLLNCVDVYVSLHRAEGFGLVMAEAMLLGTPVIATNWSANTEFMNNEVACMVDYELVKLEKDYGPFKKGQHWAEPNIGQAAEYMKVLYMDEELKERLSHNGKCYIESNLSLKNISEIMKKRISEIT